MVSYKITWQSCYVAHPLQHWSLQAAHSNPRSLSGPGDLAATGLAVTRLVPIVRDLFTAGIAPSTRKVYATGSSRYRNFCTMTQLSPYPASENTMMVFVAHLHNERLAPGNMKSYLAAIRHEQISMNSGDPQIPLMPQLEYVLKEAKQRATVGTHKRLRTNYPQ